MSSSKPNTICVAHEPLVESTYALILGANVERLRKRARINKKTFSAMTGIGRPLLNRIERGEANPRLVYIERIATALGVTPADLLTPPLD